MSNRCFVNSLSQVSCQKPLCDEWLESPYVYDEQYMRAQEPDTKGFIPPSEARRLSKILKRTVCTAITALNNSEIKQPQAIITGTGAGCMENTEKFLIDLSKFGENCLKPTLFMQSTHNTMSSLIAIILKCHGYNNTYSHKGISFESALLDAFVQIRSGVISNALVGSHDEVSPFMNLVLRHTHPEYGFISEISMSSVLTATHSEKNIAEIRDVRLFYKPSVKEISSYLDPQVDELLMLGVNGVALNDEPYQQLLDSLSYSPTILQYKNIFGENYSASAIGFYVASKIIEKQSVPDFLRLENGKDNYIRPKYITILNHSDSNMWSLIRLKQNSE